jgi:hypothetical protein
VRITTLHLHHNRFVLFVAYNDTLQYALRHDFLLRPS